ncbi:MAG TPA: MBL fold metallo-hydrolase [Gemmatimonadaceae bacterium]|nr:MBL fold metallo-hydrolase [Gemmatimonadaceae bacterium]
MIEVRHHGDVTRVILTSRGSRLIGMSASAFLVRGVLIDTGLPRAGAVLEGWLSHEGLPRGVLVTHAHEDHAGNVERLARLGIPMGMGELTLSAVRAPRPLAPYRRITWGVPEPLRSPVVPFADEELALVPTPGHSADHHVAWDAREGTLFSGDLFLGVRSATVHRTERPKQLVESLRRVVALGPERMFDSHRGLVDRPVQALEARVAWLETTIGRVEELIARGWGDAAIQREVLGREGLARAFSFGEYSKRNLVRAVRESTARG